MCMYYIYVFMYDQALNYNSIINSSHICIYILYRNMWRCMPAPEEDSDEEADFDSEGEDGMGGGGGGAGAAARLRTMRHIAPRVEKAGRCGFTAATTSE